MLRLANATGRAFRGTYNVKFYLSADPKLSRKDRLFSRQSIATTVPGHEEKSLKLRYTLPKNSPVGTRYLIVVAKPVRPDAARGRAALVASRQIKSVSRITIIGTQPSARILSTKSVPHSGTTRVTVRVTNNTSRPLSSANATIRLLRENNAVLLTTHKTLNLAAHGHEDLQFILHRKVPANARATVEL